jgi:hypothetical protein
MAPVRSAGTKAIAARGRGRRQQIEGREIRDLQQGAQPIRARRR